MNCPECGGSYAHGMPILVGDTVRIEHAGLKLKGVLRGVGKFIEIDVPADGGKFHRINVDAALAGAMERA